MKKEFLLALSVGGLCAMHVCSTDAEEDKGRSSPSVNLYHDPEFLKNRYMKPRPNNKPSSGASLEALERKAAESNVRDEEPLSKATSPKARAQTSTKEVM
jgi:hypothetical protein